MNAATPLEEIQAALRATRVLAPDLAVPAATILRDAERWACQKCVPAEQELMVGPGILGLARAINARALAAERQDLARKADPVEVAQAAQEAL